MSIDLIKEHFKENFETVFEHLTDGGKKVCIYDRLCFFCYQYKVYLGLPKYLRLN